MADAVTQESGSDFDNAMAGMLAQQSGIPSPAPLRDDGGKFAASRDEDKPDPAEKVVEAVKPEPAKAAEPEKKAEAAAEDEEDYVELPPEQEGAEPTRLKVSDLIAAHKAKPTLEQELAKYKSAPALPAELETELTRTVQERAKVIETYKQLEAFMQPAVPDETLLNRNSPNYDPDLYAQQLGQYRAATNALQYAKSEQARLQKEQSQEADTLNRARINRELQVAVEEWPDLKDNDKYAKIVADTSKIFGIPENEVKQVYDHRHLRLIKYALDGYAAKQAKEAAVKVVTAKPKLVRGQARSTQSGKTAAFSASYEKVAQSHSLDDAVGAIAALL